MNVSGTYEYAKVTAQSPQPSETESNIIGTRKRSIKYQSIRVTNRKSQISQEVLPPNEDNSLLILNAIKLINDKESIKKGVQYLVRQGIIQNTPEDVVQFLKLYGNEINDVVIGDYLGEGGENDEEIEFYKKIRLLYLKTSYAGKTFEEALRFMLTQGGFKLPGESQKIERFVDAFAQLYYEDHESEFKNSDTVMILAYSTIMLNTDAHNPNVRKDRKMTKEQFINQNRGIDDGNDLPERMLSDLYDKIVTNEIKIPRNLPVETPEADEVEDESSIALFEEQTSINNLLSYIITTEPKYHPYTSEYNEEIIRSLYLSICWHVYFTIYDIFYNEMNIIEKFVMNAVDLCSYSIVAGHFLSLIKHRNLFIDLIIRYKLSIENKFGTMLNSDLERLYNKIIRKQENNANFVVNIQDILDKLKYQICSEIQKDEINRLKDKFKNDISEYLVPNDYILKEGLISVFDEETRKTKEYYCYLLTTYLLITQDAFFNKQTIIEAIDLSTIELQDLEDNIEYGNGFLIMSGDYEYVICCLSIREKHLWINAINV